MSKIIVLGAGASRAAGVRAERKLGLSCLPPLNADFFTHLQRVTDRKFKEVVARTMRDVVELFGSNFSLTLEDYFSQVEFLLETVDIASRNPDIDRDGLAKRRDNLMEALSAVLESSTLRIIDSDSGCELHRRLVQSLSSADSIVSFNYDCLIDDALRRHGNGTWNPRWGYAFPLRQPVTGLEAWDSEQAPVGEKESIRLFKLHGSVHWQLPADTSAAIHLKRRIHKQNGVPRFSIIPPVSNKSLGSAGGEGTIYRSIWRRCAMRIRNAEVIGAVGFSFAETDLYAQSLFRIAVEKNKKLRLLVVVTPGRETRRRIRSVFDVPLANGKVLVRQYESFEEFARHLPDALA